jgi:hypothetical protein
MAHLLRNQATLDAIIADKPLKELRAAWQPELEEFQKRRAKYLIYE